MTFRLFAFAILLVLVFSSCRTMYTLPSEIDEDFQSSEKSVAEVIDMVRQGNRPVGIEGRARVQVSAPGERERVVVEFRAVAEQTVLRVRNSLGIEGARLFIDTDSVLVYDRINDTAIKMDRETGSRFLIQGISAIELMDVLFPKLNEDFRGRVYESSDSFLLFARNGNRYFVDKHTGDIKRIYKRTPDHYWATFRFDNFTDRDGYRYPSRAQVLSYDEKSNIFILIQNISFLSEDSTIVPEIPGHISIDRL